MKTSELVLQRVLERIDQVKVFPSNTSPALRMIEAFGIALMKGESYFLVEEDPEGVGLVLLSLVEDYYQLHRQFECYKKEHPFGECATVASH